MGTGEQLPVAATIPPLPSLAEFPEEIEHKELNLKQEREKKKQVSEKQLFHTQDIV